MPRDLHPFDQDDFPEIRLPKKSGRKLLGAFGAVFLANVILWGALIAMAAVAIKWVISG